MKRGFSLWMALVLAIMTFLPGYAEESGIEAPVELATDAGDTGLIVLPEGEIPEPVEADPAEAIVVEEIEEAPVEMAGDASGLYYARVTGTDAAIPAGSVVLVIGAADGMLRAVWRGDDGVAEGAFEASALERLTPDAVDAYMDDITRQVDVPLYNGLLDYPLAAPFRAAETAEAETASDEAGEAADASVADVADVVIDAENLILGVREKYTLNAWAVDAEGRRLSGVTVKWASADSKTAKVTSKGVVTAVKVGETRLAASVGDIAATVTVKVMKKPAKVILEETALSIAAGSTYRLAPQADEGAWSAVYRYSSSKTGVATVSAEGVITAVSKGSATITVKSYNSKKATVKVTVTNPPVRMEGGELAVCENMTAALPVRLYDINGALTHDALTAAIAAESADPGCIALDAEKGTVTGVRKGEAVVDVACGELTAKVRVTVAAGPADMALDRDALAIGVKETYTVGYTLIPKAGETACAAEVKWSSSNAKVAKVDAATGEITAVKAGRAVVSATTQNGIVRTVAVTVGKAPTKLTVKPSTMKLTEDMTLPVEVTVNSGAACSTYTYESSNETVATVDANGNVTGHGTGAATITVRSYNKKKATVKVQVLGLPRALTLDQTEVDLAAAQTHAIAAKVTDGTGALTETNYTYTVISGAEYATVSDRGVVTALKKGAAQVEVRTHNGITATLTVNVADAPADILVNESALSLGVKETWDGLRYTLVPPEGEAHCAAVVRWSSSNAKIVKVDEVTGALTALKKGSATVTATTHNGLTARVAVTVEKAPTKLTLTPAKPELSVETTLQLIAVPNSGAASHSVTFESADPSVATVDANGLVTGVRRGTAVITATTFNKKKAKVTVTVNSKPERVELEGKSLLNKTSVTLSAKALDAQGMTVPASFTYSVDASSADPGCVSVTAAGRVTGVRPGRAVVRATLNEKLYALCDVTVLPAPSAVSLDETSVVLGVKETWEGPEVHMTFDAGVEAVATGYTWSSSNPKIASVDPETGVVTGVKKGKATITVTVENGLSDSYEVQVLTAPKSITVKPATLSLSEGMTYDALTVSMSSTSGCRTLSYVSDNPAAVTVDQAGRLTAVAPGKAVITVSAFNGVKDTVSVTVTGAPTQVFSTEALSLSVGDSYTLESYAADSAGNRVESSFTYAVLTGADVVSVSDKGVVKALKKGEATIRVSTQNGVHTHVELEGAAPVDTVCRVTVVDAPKTVTLSPTTLTLEAGERYTLKPVVKDAQKNVMTDVSLTYTSSNEKVATVSAKGVITAVSGGKAVITVSTLNGVTAKCTVNVSAKERYRFFGVYNFFEKGDGALHFPKNNAYSVEDVMSAADINGASYELLGVVGNPTKANWLAALDDAFSDSQDSDINVIYFCSHGYDKVDGTSGHYGMQLPGYNKNNANTYITSSEFYSHLSRINGKIVLILDSCYSGVFIDNLRSRLSAEGGRIAVMTAADDTTATYNTTTDTNRAHDYFTLYLLEGAGYSMTSHKFSGGMPADSNGDGQLTFYEMFHYARDEVLGNMSKNSRSSFHGSTAQDPQCYAGSLGNLVLFG